MIGGEGARGAGGRSANLQHRKESRCAGKPAPGSITRDGLYLGVSASGAITRDGVTVCIVVVLKHRGSSDSHATASGSVQSLIPDN